eukprot:1740172-Rhodomonas_salina.2
MQSLTEHIQHVTSRRALDDQPRLSPGLVEPTQTRVQSDAQSSLGNRPKFSSRRLSKSMPSLRAGKVRMKAE